MHTKVKNKRHPFKLMRVAFNCFLNSNFSMLGLFNVGSALQGNPSYEMKEKGNF